MDLQSQEKIRRFMEDPLMAKAVKRVLRETFLKRSTKTDVYALAAERMAYHLLNDAWSVLETYAKRDEERPARSQPGM